MSTAIDNLLKAFKQEKAFTAPPPELHDLAKQSRYVLKTQRGNLDDITTWNLVQQHFYLMLMTGDDAAAELAMQELKARFGEDNERVVLCQTQYIEVTEGLAKAEEFLKSRDEKEIIPMKRRIALDKFRNDYKTFIGNLKVLVGYIPVDAELWAELGEAYSTINEYKKAIFSFQEVLLFAPQAYNIFARIGELYHAAALQEAGGIDSAASLNNSSKESVLNSFKQALKNFLRSVELCPVYVRGWAGVQVVSNEALKFIEVGNASSHLTEKELKYFKQFAEISERNLLYASSEKNASKKDIEAAKAILRDY